MAQSILFDKKDLRVKLKEMGLTDLQLEEITALFDQRNRHMDIVAFVSNIERFAIPRAKIYSFLKNAGVDDPTLISVFSRVDLRKAGLDEDRIQEVVFSD